MKKEIIKVCCIEWEDATLIGREQLSKDSPDIKLMNGFSCGVLVKEDKRMIALAADYFDDKGLGAIPYRTVQVYPKSGIKKIHRLKFEAIKLS